MKTLVLGSKGMLGSDLVPVWDREHELICPLREECDISDRTQVRETINTVKPGLVLLLAAATDVDRCQVDPGYAFGTNSFGAEVVAQECFPGGIPLLYMSTIAVFDGSKHAPYMEYDDVSPANRYGRSKLHGEMAVRTYCPMHWIVRTGWLFGGGPRDMKFVAKILRKASNSTDIPVVRDCVGSPTYTADLARGLLDLVKRYPFGTYHMVNGGEPASRYELARHVMTTAGLSPDIIVPCLSTEMDLPAPRPAMEAAVSAKLGLIENGLALPSWRDSLASYVHERLSQIFTR